MATSEGVFPKVGNDPIYYSEVNRFAGAGQFIKIGSTIGITSGTNYQDAGSILIAAGSLSNPFTLMFNSLNDAQGGGQTMAYNIYISGTSANTSVNVNDAFPITSIFYSNGLITGGSPFRGATLITSALQGADNNAPQCSSTSINNLNPNEPVVVGFKIKYNGTTSGTMFYSLQSFRGAV